LSHLSFLSSSYTYSTTTHQQSPIMDAAAIEQMNKMRVSLGMAPLPVPGGSAGPEFKQKDDGDSESEEDNISTLDKRQAAAGDNWQKLEAERQEKVDREKRKEAAKKVMQTRGTSWTRAHGSCSRRSDRRRSRRRARWRRNWRSVSAR
jgi:hypothetical protein